MSRFDWEAGDVTIEFAYGMRLRGFSPGAQPMEGFIRREDDKTGSGFWDVLIYDHKLDEKEVEQYDLEFIFGGNR